MVDSLALGTVGKILIKSILQLLMAGSIDPDMHDYIITTRDKLNGVQLDTNLYGITPDGAIVPGIDISNLTVAAMNAIHKASNGQHNRTP